MGCEAVLTTTAPSKSLKPQIDAATPVLGYILDVLEDAKAENTVHVDITGKSSLADHMIVTSGRSHRHVGAVADQLSRSLKENGFDKPRMEGLPHCDWVLIDAGDVIVHIFRPEVREFYNIEKMWAAEFATDQIDT